MFELSALNALTIAAWTTLLLWLAGAFLTLRGIYRQQPLSPASLDEESDAPFVSILVPARNEEHRILARAVRSMLDQDYPRYEVIVVDDRSIDATKSILNELAANDPRLLVIDGADLPAGWLGKPHAMGQALSFARGSWVLATDADVTFAREALSTAIAHVLTGDYDAVTLIPYIECLSFWERVFMPTFGWFMLVARPIDRVNDPRRREAIGIGGFFLIRRTALERIGGYAAVRTEVAEDLRTAELLKESGARLRIEYAPDLLRTRMQTNLSEIWEGFTKNLFAGARFALLPALSGSIAVLLFAVAPFFVAVACALVMAMKDGAPSDLVSLFIPVALVWIVQVTTFMVIDKNWGIPLAYAFTVPLGHLLFVAILLNSALLIASGRGVKWKGRTLYARAGDVQPPRSTSFVQTETGQSSHMPITDERR